MKYFTQVVASNQVNRKGSVFTNEALEDGARQINEKGLPQFINHDWTRLVGWSWSAWTEERDGVVCLVAKCAVPESAQEVALIRGLFVRHFARLKDNRLSPYRHYLNHPGLSGCTLLFDTSCVYLYRKDLLASLLPQIARRKDDDGLTPLKELSFTGEGWLGDGSYMAVPHHAFRQSHMLPNSLNWEFLSALLRARSQSPGLEVTLRFENDLVAIADSLKPSVELEYWWGPHYKGDPFSIPYGVSVHGPTEHDNPIDRLKQTEFWWYGKDRRTFELEEVYHNPVLLKDEGCSGIATRFVHSIFDGNLKIPIHLDGALRVYGSEAWEKRKATTIDKFGKNAIRVKLWRVDGPIQLPIWYSLVHSFFKHNFTVPEYFGVGWRDDGVT